MKLEDRSLHVTPCGTGWLLGRAWRRVGALQQSVAFPIVGARLKV